METLREFPQENSLTDLTKKSRPQKSRFFQFVPKIVRTALAVTVGSIGASSAPIEAFRFSQNQPLGGSQTVEMGLPSLQATILNPSGQRMRVLYEEGSQNPERVVFNKIEVISASDSALSDSALGEGLAVLFKDAEDGTVHAALMRPDLPSRRWIGEEIKVHPDIKILHGNRPISGGIKMSEDGKILVVFGYRGNPEVYSNEGAFSFDGETLYTHPEMGEITGFEFTTDNRIAFITSRKKDNAFEAENYRFDLNNRELRRFRGDLARVETRIRPTVSGNTYTGYFPNLENRDNNNLVGYTESTVTGDGTIVNRTLHPEQGPLDLGRMVDFQIPGKDRVVSAINRYTRNQQGQDVSTVFFNNATQSTTTSWQPDIDRVIGVVGGIPDGYYQPSVGLFSSTDFKGSDNVVVSGGLLVLRRTDMANRWFPFVAGVSPDNPNITGFLPTKGLPKSVSLEEVKFEIMSKIFTLRLGNNVTTTITTISKIPYFHNPDAKEWQTGPVSLQR